MSGNQPMPALNWPPARVHNGYTGTPAQTPLRTQTSSVLRTFDSPDNPLAPIKHRKQHRNGYENVIKISGRRLTVQWYSYSAGLGPDSHDRVPRLGCRERLCTRLAAYVVFCGLQCGVFETWNKTHALVSGVANSIFRGYPTVAEAQAAFAYATIRGWTRVAGRPVVSGIAQLPQPINIQNTRNALNSDAEFNSTCKCPSSHSKSVLMRDGSLESQLNTVGVRGALHESIIGLSAAIKKYRNATSRGEISRMRNFAKCLAVP
ncbi:hypothetical protein C8F04DRAFT_1193684 [Mycena alexandri]|uniref:Ribonuclease H1 N-terminal domain-containing protein n=1 Tax=Mycena alexandri TaxID=1745969 RepID=A0AAD6WQA8_9AGAR|nr:hypothetical protein C8F04DRAFT_1193684 [Mycena alexandri]